MEDSSIHSYRPDPWRESHERQKVQCSLSREMPEVIPQALTVRILGSPVQVCPTGHRSKSLPNINLYILTCTGHVLFLKIIPA